MMFVKADQLQLDTVSLKLDLGHLPVFHISRAFEFSVCLDALVCANRNGFWGRFVFGVDLLTFFFFFL